MVLRQQPQNKQEVNEINKTSGIPGNNAEVVFMYSAFVQWSVD